MVSLKRDPYREPSYFRLGRTILRSDTPCAYPHDPPRTSSPSWHLRCPCNHHTHFGSVWLSLGAVSDWQRDAGVVIGRLETGDQIKRNEAVHVTHSTRSCARSSSRASGVA